jgi:hypothetical protein
MNYPDAGKPAVASKQAAMDTDAVHTTSLHVNEWVPCWLLSMAFGVGMQEPMTSLPHKMPHVPIQWKQKL